MTADFGLLLLSGILGTILGFSVLLVVLYTFYYIKVQIPFSEFLKSNPQIYTRLVAPNDQSKEMPSHQPQTVIHSNEIKFPQPSRRFSIPDPSSARSGELLADQETIVDIHLPATSTLNNHLVAAADEISLITNDNIFNSTRSNSPEMTKSSATYECIIPYIPKQKDDLELRVGDLVSIIMTFTDGMGHGLNNTTNQKGMFPLNCLSLRDATPVGITPPEQVSMDFPPLAPEGQGKLLFSMIDPDQALEFVNSSMSSERRKQYFDNLLKNPSSGNNTPFASNNSLNSVESGSSSRASRNWSRLRVGWKDAVKEELRSSYEAWEAQRNRSNFWKMIAMNYC